MVNVNMGGRKQLVIEEIWAYCCEDEEGEGLVGYHQDGHGWIPLVGADEERVKLYDEMAQRIANGTGKKIICKKFTHLEIVKTFTSREKK